MLVLNLFSALCLLAIISNTSCSYVGSEEFLRSNIMDLFQGKLKFSDDTLPFEADELSDSTPKNHSEYDFIVIGAGSAGSVIASRLSEIKNITVLLIEAGGKEYSFMDIPMMGFPLGFSDEINWNYRSESSDEFCQGMTNQQCILPIGKVMGGSSSINLMIATRGNRRDYDNWADYIGDNSWSYKNMLKYFKKLENFGVNNSTFDENMHDKNGPIPITIANSRVNLTDAFIEAGKELGYDEVDYNSFEQRGFSYFQSTVYQGERWSTNRAYLRSAKMRNNLIVTQRSHVLKILINPKTKIAYGVRYSKNGKIYEVRTTKEIILSAGAINSPQILMLSGIGPKEHLREFNIDVIKDSSVGQNLQDHIACSALIFKVNDSMTFQAENLLGSAVGEYVNSKTGPLAIGVSQAGVSFINVNDPQDFQPNIEFIFGNNQGIKDPIMSSLIGINNDLRNQMNADVFNHSAWSIWPMLLTPRSRGEILLRSTNPFDKPIIRPNYLADPEDVRILIKGMRKTIELSKTRSMRKFGSELYRIPSSCHNHDMDSDDYWECLLRTYTTTIYHYAGTCKMGKENSDSSVVNSKLKVIGINNLRVVDASIMPNIITGHTNIPTIAIGEKAADMIKRAHGLI